MASWFKVLTPILRFFAFFRYANFVVLSFWTQSICLLFFYSASFYRVEILKLLIYQTTLVFSVCEFLKSQFRLLSILFKCSIISGKLMVYWHWNLSKCINYHPNYIGISSFSIENQITFYPFSNKKKISKSIIRKRIFLDFLVKTVYVHLDSKRTN